MKSDEVKTRPRSGWAWRALVTPARAFSWFHSVGMRATTSIASAQAAAAWSNPSRRPIEFTSPRSPTRIAAFCLRPVWRASVHRCSTVARAMPRLSATTATDFASEGSAGRLNRTMGIPASFAPLIAGMIPFASFGTTTMPSTRRATNVRTCSSCRLASPSAIASTIS